MTLTSLWQDRHPRTASAEPAGAEGRCDVAVIGAGLTGLTTALLLARAGRAVMVLEADRVFPSERQASAAALAFAEPVTRAGQTLTSCRAGGLI